MSATLSLDPLLDESRDLAAAGLGTNAGAVVGLLRGGERRVVACGVLDAGGPPPDEYTVFEIGSITKTFTALVLADMALRGEVGLGDPVRKYLPDTVRVPTWKGQEITLLHLATHTSSLPRLPGNLWKTVKDPANPYANYQVSDLYEFLSAHRLRRPVGSREEYSNLGMGLLGHVLGLAAGKGYEELVGERVLRPLGLDDTSVTLRTDQQQRLAPGHAADGKVTAGWNLPALAGAGALRSTARDMLSFAAAALCPATSPLAEPLRLCQRLQPLPTGPRPPWKGYATALLFSGLGLLAQRQLGLVPGNGWFALAVFAPILAAVWLGGPGTGLLATTATVAGTCALQQGRNFGWGTTLLLGSGVSLAGWLGGGHRQGAMLAWQHQPLYVFGRGPRMVWHNGGTGGYASFLGFTRDTEAAVVVLANSAKSVDDVGVGLLRLLNREA
jgi:CubicO group peptidase (beta-lactamase class C family)